jgi:hypothetical protein
MKQSYLSYLSRMPDQPLAHHLTSLYSACNYLASKLRQRQDHVEFRAMLLRLAIRCYTTSLMLPNDRDLEQASSWALTEADLLFHYLDDHPEVMQRLPLSNGTNIFSDDRAEDARIHQQYTTLVCRFKIELDKARKNLISDEAASTITGTPITLTDTYIEYKQLIRSQESEMRLFLSRNVYRLPDGDIAIDALKDDVGHMRSSELAVESDTMVNIGDDKANSAASSTVLPDASPPANNQMGLIFEDIQTRQPSVELRLLKLRRKCLGIGRGLCNREDLIDYRQQVLDASMRCYMAACMLRIDQDFDVKISDAVLSADMVIRRAEEMGGMFNASIPSTSGSVSADPVTVDNDLKYDHRLMVANFKTHLLRIFDALNAARSSRSSDSSEETVGKLLDQYYSLIKVHESEMRGFVRKEVFRLPAMNTYDNL